MRKLAAATDAAHEARRAARARLRALTSELPRARTEAAKRIAAEWAPAMNRAAAAFLKARIERLADEIVACATIIGLRDDLTDARRVGLRNMVLPGTAVGADQEMRLLREDTAAAIAAGVLQAKDVPAAVRQAWGIG